MTVEWSARALADLNRFATFLDQHFPRLAPLVGRELIGKAEILGSSPKLGAAIEGDEDYRRLVLRVLNAPYVLQYHMPKTASSLCASFTAAKRVTHKRTADCPLLVLPLGALS